LASDSIVIQTCFLNLLLEFTRTTYRGNLHPIGLPDLTRSTYQNLARTSYLTFIQAPYPSLTQLHQCLPGLIRPYSAESPYPILLPTKILLTWPYTVLPGRITSPNRTSAYLIIPGFLSRPGNASLHPTAYSALPNQLARPGTLQLA
jgi:hypothetical protein